MTEKAAAKRCLPNETDAAPDIVEIAQTMGRMRLMIGRRIISRTALSKAAPDLELSHLDVIEAVRRIAREGEVTVGAVAEAMRIDPSRGSRLVADLVQRGFLMRAVSQTDARRAVVELTGMALAYFQEAERVKRRFIETIVADWSSEEVARFAGLFSRFVTGFEQLARTPEN